MVALANVTRIEEGRATYMTARGEEKETFAKLYLSLVHRLYGRTAAELNIALYVLEQTRFDSLPQRISVRRFMEICQLSNRAVQEGVDRLVNAGILYQEREPDTKNIRYALIDATNPISFLTEQEDGSMTIWLLGGVPYAIPEGVLLFSTLKFSGKCTKKEYARVLKSSTRCTKKAYTPVAESSTSPSCQPAQNTAPSAPRESYREIPERRESKVASPASSHSQEPRGTSAVRSVWLSEKAEQETLLDAPAQAPTPPKQRKPDLLWDKAVALFHQPMGGEVKNWRYTIIPELHRQGITPEQLAAAAKRYKEKYPKLTYSLRAVFNNLGELLDVAAAPVTGLASAYHFADEDGPAWARRRPAPEGGR